MRLKNIYITINVYQINLFEINNKNLSNNITNFDHYNKQLQFPHIIIIAYADWFNF